MGTKQLQAWWQFGEISRSNQGADDSTSRWLALSTAYNLSTNWFWNLATNHHLKIAWVSKHLRIGKFSAKGMLTFKMRKLEKARDSCDSGLATGEDGIGWEKNSVSSPCAQLCLLLGVSPTHRHPFYFLPHASWLPRKTLLCAFQ